MRILFITLTNIGDVILSTVLLDRVLSTHKGATVDIVVGKGAASLFEGFPNLGRLIPVIKKKRHGHYFDIYKELKHEKYDVIIDLRTPLLGRFLSGKKKITFKSNMKEHKAEQLAKLWPLDEERPHKQMLSVSDEVKAKVRAEVEKLDGPIVALGPTANWIGKQWPQRKFAQMAEELSKLPEFKNAYFAVFGAPHERASVADLVSFIPKEKCIDLIGKTTLPEVYAWLTHASLFVGNDSGLSHMAAAANIPTVSVFGPTWPHVYSPVSQIAQTVIAPERDVVNLEPEAEKRLICDVSVEDVVQAVQKVMVRAAEKSAA